MQTWEYKVAEIIPSELKGYLDGMGKLGWELTISHNFSGNHHLIFKRPSQKEAKA